MLIKLSKTLGSYPQINPHYIYSNLLLNIELDQARGKVKTNGWPLYSAKLHPDPENKSFLIFFTEWSKNVTTL